MPGIDQLLQRSTTVAHQRNGGCTLPSIKGADVARFLTSRFPNPGENLRPKQWNEMQKQFRRIMLAGGLRPTVQHALPVRALQQVNGMGGLKQHGKRKAAVLTKKWLQTRRAENCPSDTERNRVEITDVSAISQSDPPHPISCWIRRIRGGRLYPSGLN